jgi:hypothetical protein
LNELFEQLAIDCAGQKEWDFPKPPASFTFNREELAKFAELLKQAIYDQVKQELIDDADINATTDPLAREYLKGCNGGTVDALCHIQNFGVDIDE